MYKIAIVDDDKTDSSKMETIVSSWAERTEGIGLKLCTFPSAQAFLFSYDQDKDWDVLLLDVEMPQMSGIELAKRLRIDGLRAEIIFITSHFEFWGEGYEVDALHYLTKPVTAEKLLPVLDKACARRKDEPKAVVISCDGETVRVNLDEILYVEAFSHYISIYTAEREYRIKEKISGFGDLLGEGFFRIHRSYLVSLKQIIRISRKAVTVCGGIELPLARGNYDAVSRAFIELGM